ncbi:hypothetical protein LCGC14_0273060 [marine sediment metagenome]|uniref:Uncharacterized protein n=2 Tax=root TaxID=1 RepID=A0A9C9NEI4_9HYPH|nr:hypothetical protein [Aurantimonas coralicida]
MQELNGLCYIGEPPNGEMIRMADLRPGDIFRLIPRDDPAMPVIIEEAESARSSGRCVSEQSTNLFRAMVKRARLYRYEQGDPTADGKAQCWAEEVEV